jgi:DNA replication licensing factor MCM5
VEGFTSQEDQETFNRVEKQLKKRFQVGTYVSEHLIIDEFNKQSYAEALVRKVNTKLGTKRNIQFLGS